MVLFSICNIFWMTFDFVIIVSQKLIWEIVAFAAKFRPRKVELIIHTVCHHFDNRKRISCVLAFVQTVLHQVFFSEFSVTRGKVFTPLVQKGVFQIGIDRYGRSWPSCLHDCNGSIMRLFFRHFLSTRQSTAVGKIILFLYILSSIVSIYHFY